MRIRIQKRGLVPALVVAVVGTVLLYLASTVGLAAWNSSRAAPQPGPGALPTVVENAPPSVPTTDHNGPIGGISLVFAGTDVRDGLRGRLEHPWIAVSAHTGEYRAIDAPDLPAAGPAVLTTNHDGNLLAWATGDGVVVYDPVTGEARTLPVEAVDLVGDFSPDSNLLIVHGAELGILDVGTGDLVATAAADKSVPGRTAWRTDSSAVDFVVEDQLTTLGVEDGTVSTQPTDIPEPASLAWSPDGDQLANLREVDGVNRLFVSTLGDDGTLAEGERLSTEGIALEHLIGFSGERTIAVAAYVLDSGSVERILDIRLDDRPPGGLMTLPQPGENWVDSSTLAIASDNLLAGSTEYDGQVWPWSYTSRLVACTLFVGFLLGLYVTRRPRSSRR
ncbi:MAG: hypothetical protein ACXWDL_07830 [Nocardioides sp.]